MSEEREIRSSEDVVGVRQLVRAQVVALEFSLIDQTKLAVRRSSTAAAEE